MRCPKCYTETSNEVLCCPKCNLVTPKGRQHLKTKGQKPALATRKARRKKAPKKERKRVPRWVTALALIGTVVVCGAGSFFVWLYYIDPQPVDASSPQFAIERLRSRPSKQSGLTVENRLAREVESSRASGQFVELEGWTVTPIDGAKCRVVFSIEEKEHRYRRAEWMVEMPNGPFLPQTELATEVYGD
jgi:hypothetical protein